MKHSTLISLREVEQAIKMTPKALIQSLSDPEVEAATSEALEWRKKGVLRGEALRGVASRLVAEAGINEDESIRTADTLIIEEAAVRYVSIQVALHAETSLSLGI